MFSPVNTTEKIYAFLKRDKWTLHKFAKETGISRTKLWRVNTGQGSFDDNELLKLSRAFGVTVDYLLRADYFPPQPGDKLNRIPRRVGIKQAEEVRETLETIPIISYVSAGEIEVPYGDAGYPVGYGIDEIRRPDGVTDPNAYALFVKGNSMAPFLPEDSLVVVVTNTPAKAGDVVICRERTTGKGYVKQLRRTDSVLVLESFNTQDHDPLIFRKEDVSLLHPRVWFRRAR